MQRKENIMETFSIHGSDNNLPVMMLPLNTDNMLVPDIMVIEICESKDIQTVDQSPDWFIGYSNWRNYKVPVISFEALNGAMAVDVSQVNRIAIIKTTAEHGYLPYYAIAVSDMPAMYEVSGETVLIEARVLSVEFSRHRKIVCLASSQMTVVNC